MLTYPVLTPTRTTRDSYSTPMRKADQKQSINWYHFSTGPGSSLTACAVNDKSVAQEGRGGQNNRCRRVKNEKENNYAGFFCIMRYMEARKKEIKIVDAKK